MQTALEALWVFGFAVCFVWTVEPIVRAYLPRKK